MPISQNKIESNLNLGFRQLKILSMIGKNPGMMGSEIWRESGMERNTTYVNLQRVTEDGLASRKGEDNPTYTLTAKGKKTLSAVHKELGVTPV